MTLQGSALQSSASELLRSRGAAAWEAATGHPMVAEIGAGTLPHKTFRYYFEQNTLYLEDYARAIALVIARAPARADIEVLSAFLAQIVETELPANYSFLERLGGQAGRSMAPTTYAYTRHLLDTASRRDLAAGLTALLPCQWSYGEIGVRLAAASLPDDPICAEWISMFSGDGYDGLIRASTALLDRYAAGNLLAVPGSTGSLSEIFDRSTRYELAFWTMAYSCGQSDATA
jgi:thiaminase/transcriptional activator TenA